MSTSAKKPNTLAPSSKGTGMSNSKRAARMTALVWTPDNAPAQNLFTLVRTRQRDIAGPWIDGPNKAWYSKTLDDDLRFLRLDTTDTECHHIVERIVQKGKFTAAGLTIHYELDPVSQAHRAYRDHLRDAERAVISPFRHHSAAITEYWSFADAPLRRWLDLTSPPSSGLMRALKRLCFPLERSSDRTGNLMVAQAEDSFSADLNFDPQQKVLRLRLRPHSPVKGPYRATVWAGYAGNTLLRREIPSAIGMTQIASDSDVDHIGFAIYETTSGDCVDLKDVGLIMDASFNVRMQSGPTLQFQTKKRKRLVYSHAPRIHSTLNVRSNEWNDGRDKRIRDKWLSRLRSNEEASAKQRKTLGRFSAAQHVDAAAYFLKILQCDADSKTPIYIADPYFLPAKRDPFLESLYLRIFGESVGQPLRVLCGNVGSEDARLWWRSLPKQIIGHVSVRSFVRRDDHQSCFHDRYVVTPKREVIVTNSFNGWAIHGVTLADLPCEVYRTEANELWAKDAGSTDADILVTEVT